MPRVCVTSTPVEARPRDRIIGHGYILNRGGVADVNADIPKAIDLIVLYHHIPRVSQVGVGYIFADINRPLGSPRPTSTNWLCATKISHCSMAA